MSHQVDLFRSGNDLFAAGMWLKMTHPIHMAVCGRMGRSQDIWRGTLGLCPGLLLVDLGLYLQV